MNDGTLAKTALKIRSLGWEDIEDIIQIDSLVAGERRPEYWRQRFSIYMHRHELSCLAAEVEGKLAGFAIGDVRGWEFGVSDEAGWIEVVAVYPQYRRLGVARALVEQLLEHFRWQGVKNVYCLVGPHTRPELVEFYRHMGFEPTQLAILSREA